MIHKDYGTANYVSRNIAQLSAARLREWATRGWLRTVKLGESRQSTRLYHLGDVSLILERMSRGQMPLSRQRSKSTRPTSRRPGPEGQDTEEPQNVEDAV